MNTQVRATFDWEALDRELASIPARDAVGAETACRRVRQLIAAYVLSPGFAQAGRQVAEILADIEDADPTGYDRDLHGRLRHLSGLVRAS